MNIYSVPDLYDAIHKDSSFDIQLLKTIAKSRSGSVLELASGTGRLTKCILDLGLDYTGLELSKQFIEVAKNRYVDQARFVLGDTCDFKLNMKFNFIFIGFQHRFKEINNLYYFNDYINKNTDYNWEVIEWFGNNNSILIGKKKIIHKIENL